MWDLLRLNAFLIFIAAENSNCDDYEYSSVNDRFQRIWLNTEIYYSYDACDANSQDDSKFYKLLLIIYVKEKKLILNFDLMHLRCWKWRVPWQYQNNWRSCTRSFGQRYSWRWLIFLVGWRLWMSRWMQVKVFFQ